MTQNRRDDTQKQNHLNSFNSNENKDTFVIKQIIATVVAANKNKVLPYETVLFSLRMFLAIIYTKAIKKPLSKEIIFPCR